MKKIFRILLSLTLSLSLCNAQILLASNSNTQVEYFEDGSYCITVIEDCSNLNLSDISTASTSKTVSKSKKTSYYSSSNAELWYVKVTGSFTYGNGSAVCNSSSVTAESKNSNWKISNKSSGKSGNTATASATGKRYVNGNAVDVDRKSVV